MAGILLKQEHDELQHCTTQWCSLKHAPQLVGLASSSLTQVAQVYDNIV